MKEIKVNVAVAFDGTEFYGNDRKEECKNYEKSVIEKLEKEMCNNVIIYHKDLFLGYDYHDTHICFITEYGKDLFNKWCLANNVETNITYLNSLELNKWYHIYEQIRDRHYYIIGSTSLDDLIVKYNKLYHLLNDKGKRHINGDFVEDPFITD